MSMTPDEMIEVIQAFRDGEIIQSRSIGNEIWNDDKNPNFGFYRVEFRVKPKEKVAHYRWFYTLNRGTELHITRSEYESLSNAVIALQVLYLNEPATVFYVIGPCESTKIMR